MSQNDHDNRGLFVSSGSQNVTSVSASQPTFSFGLFTQSPELPEKTSTPPSLGFVSFSSQCSSFDDNSKENAGKYTSVFGKFNENSLDSSQTPVTSSFSSTGFEKPLQKDLANPMLKQPNVNFSSFPALATSVSANPVQFTSIMAASQKNVEDSSDTAKTIPETFTFGTQSSTQSSVGQSPFLSFEKPSSFTTVSTAHPTSSLASSTEKEADPQPTPTLFGKTGTTCSFSFIKALEKETAKKNTLPLKIMPLPQRTETQHSEYSEAKKVSHMQKSSFQKKEERSSSKVSPAVKHNEQKDKLVTRERNENIICRKTGKLHSGSEKHKERRIASVSEILEITSIICKGIHPDINNKDVLMKHFCQFGEVKRISCNQSKNYAVVKFYSHDAAESAKSNGSVITPDFPSVDIFWTQKSSHAKDAEKTEMQSSTSELDEELKAMLEGKEDHAILCRPEEIQKKKKLKSKLPKKETKLKVKQNSKTPVVSDNSEEALLALLKTAVHTSAERYRMLDARDKLLRLRQQKQSDITTAIAIVGTCPDMCPEKERYSRFENNCLSVFEQKKSLDSTHSSKSIEHKVIVKEYSRSSADQEEPLPHELRPPTVLMLTMDYLICNIINKIEDSSTSVGEWYDFIWNRTRAIRKDITQQNLCDILCVDLVEKCARFHIHCAEALCEEDMSVFDSKINNENLTKSLQTLKHLYHDLLLKGVKCPNEAEFRSYDILLSLNEGDTLRQVQQLPAYIRDSTEVRFAVSAAFALNSNNYIKFFKLVEDASYLNACIMHRYFSQVRIRALQVILKAYCIPNRTEQYPLKDLVHMLKFEDTEEPIQFCQWLGLKTNENYVLLDRSAFIVPASSLITRAHKVIESKRKTSVGEIMNKGLLPVNPLPAYQPYNSFDNQGLLRDGFDTIDQIMKGVTEKQQNFKCNSCAKLYSQQDALMRHYRSHPTHKSLPNEKDTQGVTTEKPRNYKCSFCPKTYVSKGCLVRHYRIHHSQQSLPQEDTVNQGVATEKPRNYKCSFCPKTYISKGCLARHYHTHHSHESLPEEDTVNQVKDYNWSKESKEDTMSNITSYTEKNEQDMMTVEETSGKSQLEQVQNTVSNVSEVFSFFKPDLPKDDVKLHKTIANDYEEKNNDSVIDINDVDFFIRKKEQIIYDVGKELLSEVIKEETEKQVMIQIEENVAVAIMGSVLGEISKDICSEIMHEELNQKENAEKDAWETEKRKENTMKTISEEIESEVVQKTVTNLVQHEYDKLKEETLDCLSSSILLDVLSFTTEDIVKSVAKEIHYNEKEKWIALVKKAKRKTELQRARKMLIKWQRACIKRRKLETSRNMFLSGPIVPMQRNLKRPNVNFQTTISVAKKKKRVSHFLDAAILFNIIKEELSWYPFDLSRTFDHYIVKQHSHHTSKLVSWKLLLVFPENNNKNWSMFSKWLCAKFTKGYVKQNDGFGSKLCSLYWCGVGKENVAVCIRTVSLCTENFADNLKNMKKNGLLEGISGVLFVLPFESADNMVHMKYLPQLMKLLRTKSSVPAVPLYCFVVGSNITSHVSETCLNMSVLKDQKLLSEYNLSLLDLNSDYFKASEQLKIAVDWLVDKFPLIPNLTTMHLKDYAEDGLVQIFGIIYQDLAEKQKEGNLQQNPYATVSFYNAVMKKLATIASSSELEHISWPPPEMEDTLFKSDQLHFGWNSSANLKERQQILNSLILPPFKSASLEHADVWLYVREVASLGSIDTSNLFSSVSHYLHKVKQIEHKIKHQFIPWADIIYACAQYLLCCVCFIDQSSGKDLMVHYLQEELNNLNLSAMWISSVKQSSQLDNKTDTLSNGKYSSSNLDESGPKNLMWRSILSETSTSSIEATNDSFSRKLHDISDVNVCSAQDMIPEPTHKYRQDVSLDLEYETEKPQLKWSWSHLHLAPVDPIEASAKQASLKLQDVLGDEKEKSEAFSSFLESKIYEGQLLQLDSISTVNMHFSESILSKNTCLGAFDNFSTSVGVSILERGLEDFSSSLQMHKEGNRLFEKRLKSFM